MIIIFIILLIILIFLFYHYKFNKNIIENLLVTHLKPECTWGTQGELICSQVPDFEEVPAEQVRLERKEKENKINKK